MWCGVVVLVLVAIDFTPYGGKNLITYKTWFECGRRPHQVVVSFDNTKQIELSPIFTPVQFWYPAYFCSEKEAIDVGYSVE